MPPNSARTAATIACTESGEEISVGTDRATPPAALSCRQVSAAAPGVEFGDGDGGALAGKTGGDAASDAATAAGDDCDFVHQTWHPLTSLSRMDSRSLSTLSRSGWTSSQNFIISSFPR